MARGGNTDGPAGDGFASNEEWFDAQLAEVRAEKERVAREGPKPQTDYERRLMEALDKLPDGNLDPVAAMARVKLIKAGPPPAAHERFETGPRREASSSYEVVDLLSNDEV